MDGEGAICTDGPASEGSSLLPLFFLRLLIFVDLPFSSSDTGFQPGTYLSSFFASSLFDSGFFGSGFFGSGFFDSGFFGGILRFRSEKIVGREVAGF